jgi:hypothetical protein
VLNINININVKQIKKTYSYGDKTGR